MNIQNLNVLVRRPGPLFLMNKMVLTCLSKEDFMWKAAFVIAVHKDRIYPRELSLYFLSGPIFL